MRPIVFILCSFFLACYTYQSFISVKDRTDVPDGTKDIIVTKSIVAIKDTLKSNTIPYSVEEWGVQTHEILIDEGTRARYSIYIVDSLTMKIIPYWGYTEKVESQQKLWLGSDAVSSRGDEMKRVIYNKKELRPKRVFDYGVQLFGADKYN